MNPEYDSYGNSDYGGNEYGYGNEYGEPLGGFDGYGNSDYGYGNEYGDYGYGNEPIANSQFDGGLLDGFSIAPGIGLFGGYTWSQTTVYDANGNEIHRESNRGPFGGLAGFFGLF